jgi:hypothetical protein
MRTSTKFASIPSNMGGCRASPIGGIRAFHRYVRSGWYPLEWTAPADVREWAGVTARIANGGLRDEAANRLYGNSGVRGFRAESRDTG